MKIYRKFIMILVVPVCITLIVTSCKDKFTEEDLLNAQQTIDYSVVLKDAATLLGIEGATVTIVQNGVELTGTTNAQGVATFIKVTVGNGFPLTITATDYVTVNSNIFLGSVDYRQAEETNFFYTLSQTTNLATVKGVVEIETDVTNQATEVLSGAEVRAVFSPSSYNNLSLSNLNFTITATTGADGTYTMDLPTFADGVSYDVFVNDIEVNQVIAFNNEVGQPLFPATLPQVANVLTAFSNSGSPEPIPLGVPSVFATIGANPTGAGAAVAELSVNVNSLGVILSIIPFTSGSGYAASSTTIPVTISTLAGGTGATATATSNASGQITGITIGNGGTGYPPLNPNPNFASSSSPQNLFNAISIRPGDIRVINIDYGTGTSRALDIE
ncbi:MAG: hypothetical protein AB7O48_12215 [Cyclobacteriaceae bacterium]